MKRILIWSLPGDVHVGAVKWMLESIGCIVDIIYPLDICNGSKWTLFGDGGLSIRNGGSEIFYRKDYDCVWNRAVPSIFPIESIDCMKERAVSESEFEKLVTGYASSHDTNAFCVNPYGSFAGSYKKVNQIFCASSLGLNIPETIFSNDKSAILDFLGRKGGIVYKPLRAYPWRLESGVRFPCSFVIRNKCFFDDVDVWCSPAIYQEIINKKFEVRVVVMGRSIFSLLKFPISEDVPLDWRLSPDSKFFYELVEIPSEVKEGCFSLMDELGIVFACFDFGVDSTGKYYFFELNPTGQFLYFDQMGLGFSLLEAFSFFLIGSDKSFVYSRCDGVGLGDYLGGREGNEESGSNFSSFGKYWYSRVSVDLRR